MRRLRRVVGRSSPFRVFHDKSRYLLPAKILAAIREEEKGEQIAIPSEVSNLVLVSRAVCDSTVVSQTHVGLALRKIEVKNLDCLKTDQNFTVQLKPGLMIGEQLCVPTSASHSVFWAHYRDSKGRVQLGVDQKPVMRKFVEELIPEQTDKITLVIRYEGGRLLVIAAYYGDASRKLPGTTGATAEDAKWWHDSKTGEGHAFVLLQEMNLQRRIVRESYTRKCPW